MSLLKKIHTLLFMCCNTTDNIPNSPKPYRRKLPHTTSRYKTIRFNQKYKGIVL